MRLPYVAEGPLTLESMLEAMEAIRATPDDVCRRGEHIVAAEALYRPGTYTCGNCGASVDVPVPLSECV